MNENRHFRADAESDAKGDDCVCIYCMHKYTQSTCGQLNCNSIAAHLHVVYQHSAVCAAHSIAV